MHCLSSVAAATLLMGSAIAAPTALVFEDLQKRANYSVIASSAVVGFPQTVPSGTLGELYLKYQPYLFVDNGCVPFPSVEANGDVGAGLAITGASDGDCSSSTGQIYSRTASYEGYFAILYTWYMPKDEPSDGIGHVHDWEYIVVWLNEESTSATIEAVSASAHGSADSETDPALDGTSPLIEYVSYWPLDHQLAFTSTVGGQQPLIAWESLTYAARYTLNTYDYGSAIFPLSDARLETSLANAYATLS